MQAFSPLSALSNDKVYCTPPLPSFQEALRKADVSILTPDDPVTPAARRHGGALIIAEKDKEPVKTHLTFATPCSTRTITPEGSPLPDIAEDGAEWVAAMERRIERGSFGQSDLLALTAVVRDLLAVAQQCRHMQESIREGFESRVATAETKAARLEKENAQLLSRLRAAEGVKKEPKQYPAATSATVQAGPLSPMPSATLAPRVAALSSSDLRQASPGQSVRRSSPGGQHRNLYQAASGGNIRHTVHPTSPAPPATSPLQAMRQLLMPPLRATSPYPVVACAPPPLSSSVKAAGVVVQSGSAPSMSRAFSPVPTHLVTPYGKAMATSPGRLSPSCPPPLALIAQQAWSVAASTLAAPRIDRRDVQRCHF